MLQLPEQYKIVYSDAHLDEIARSSNPSPFLSALERLQAQYLTVAIEDGLPTDKVVVFDRAPSEIYQSHLEKVASHPVNPQPFQAALAWINGGGDPADVEAMAASFAENFRAKLSGIPPQLRSAIDAIIQDSELKFREAAKQALEHGNDNEAWRKTIGGENGGFGAVQGANELEQIWEKVKGKVPHQTSEQFFGFQPFDLEAGFTPPQCLAIAACCSMLDLVGFQAEKKRRKVKFQPNVQSDAMHISVAAYCDVLFSMDQRLIRRAKAIYEYRGISTQAKYVQIGG